MNCILDMDGVLADFERAVNIIEGRPEEHQSDCYDFVSKTSWEHMGRDFWENLRPTSECHYIISACEKKFGIENIAIVTSPVLTEGCAEGKIQWLRKHLPQYSRRFLIGPVKEFCASPDAVLIDDFESNCDKFERHGGQAILVPRRYNRRRNEPTLIAVMNDISLL